MCVACHKSPYPVGTFADQMWQLEYDLKQLWKAYLGAVEKGVDKMLKIRKHKGPSALFIDTTRAEEAFIEAIDELHEERRKHKVCRELNESILKQLALAQKLSEFQTVDLAIQPPSILHTPLEKAFSPR